VVPSYLHASLYDSELKQNSPLLRFAWHARPRILPRELILLFLLAARQCFRHRTDANSRGVNFTCTTRKSYYQGTILRQWMG
jgi:hypothetical protein